MTKQERKDEWVKRTTYHAPRGPLDRHAHLQVNFLCQEVGEKLINVCPDTPEFRRALDAIADARMLCNAALALERGKENTGDENILAPTNNFHGAD